ncbi:MAG: 2-C-methyl-D-erythritol 4-phosphate cytidylyltransferase [Actinomycetaceae bacterium]|nr:2-C-methyl-D-erythritol 4-phosphate cytidylyltransferase [Actinomycetaceae bacterium]
MTAPTSPAYGQDAGGAVYCVVTAAGAGTRLGFDQPKALVPVAGVPMVVRAVDAMFAHTRVVAVVVTAPAQYVGQFQSLFADYPRVRVVAGGRERQDSVSAGLVALEQFATQLHLPMQAYSPVLIHDAARPLTPVAVVETVVSSLESGLEAVIPALPVTDTIKVVPQEPPLAVGADGGYPVEPVVGAADRRWLRAVQTPQGFHWRTISVAHGINVDAAGEDGLVPVGSGATDDAALVEAQGKEVYLCEGAQLSLKITTAFDLEVANSLASR